MFCGCCRSWDDSEPSPHTPLLSNDPSKPVIRQPVTSHSKGAAVRTDLEDWDQLGPTKLGKIVVKKTKVSHIDKTFQDHASLYNNHYDKFLDIQTYMDELRGAFEADNPDHSLQKTMCVLKEKARCHLEVQRKHKNCLKIQYDEQEISSEVLSLVRTFNKANKLVREILDKNPAIIKTVSLVLKDERELRRDVLASSLGVDGPECMKHCLQDIEQLRKVPGFIEEVENQTKEAFRELVKASEVLSGEMQE